MSFFQIVTALTTAFLDCTHLLGQQDADGTARRINSAKDLELEPNMVTVEVLKSLLDLYDQLKDDNPGMAEGIKIAVMAGLNDYMKVLNPAAVHGLRPPTAYELPAAKAMRGDITGLAEKAGPVEGIKMRLRQEVVDAPSPFPPQLTQDEHDLAKQGEKIQAIKSIRARMGIDRKSVV